MKTQKMKQKRSEVEFDDIEFDFELDDDELLFKYRESNNKQLRRRQTKRKLDRLKEKKWFRQNYWFDDDYLLDTDHPNIH